MAPIGKAATSWRRDGRGLLDPCLANQLVCDAPLGSRAAHHSNWDPPPHQGPVPHAVFRNHDQKWI